MSWQTVTLGDLVKITSGFAFKSELFNDNGSGLPLVRIRDVVRGYSETFYDGPFQEQFRVSDGDILIGMDGEFNASKWAGGAALLNQRVCRIEAISPSLSSDYLFWFLPSALKAIEDRTAFVTVKHLSAKDIRSIEIPLPPLDEQRRIAAILDQADALRRKRREALSAIDALKFSLFATTFASDAARTWPLETVGNLALSVRTGPFGSQLLHSEFVESGIPVIGIDNAVQNEFQWSERRYITEEKYQELKRYTVQPRDILITIMGTCGRCAIVPDDIPLAINTKHLCCITPDQGRILPSFLHAALLQDPDILKQLGIQSKGAVMPGLNMGIVKALQLRLPPIELQQRFSEQLTELKEQSDRGRAHLAHLDALFASLQHRAFRGEL